MAIFEEFTDDLKNLIEKYEKENTMLKIEEDLDNTIVKIFGEKITALARAKNGLSDVTELSYTTAEHHPYWNILYSSAQIAQTVLEKWDGTISKKDLEDIEWAIKEIKQTLEKFKNIS